MAGRIFINYRRDDDPSAAARVRDGLAARFGKSAIFMHVDNLLAGQRFDEELAKALAQCDVLIAVIGPRWMELMRSRAASGERDYVREEIAGALKRHIAVIPVRVGREGQLPALPRVEELPEDIRDLVHYQKHDVAHERFSRDIAELVAAITALRRARQAPRPWGRIAAGVGAVAVAGVLAWGVPTYLASRSAGDDAERQRLAQLAADADAKRQAAETETARLKAEAEADRKSREAVAAEQKRNDEEAKAVAQAEADRQARAAAAAEEQRKADEAAANAKAEADAAAEKERQRLAMLAEEDRKRKEAAAADALTPGRVFRDCEDVCPEMVVVPAGSFSMGSPTGEAGRSDDEGPQHTVKIAKPFAVGKFEVTRDEFETFVQATSFKVADECFAWTGSEWKKQAGSFRQPGFDQTGTHPALCVSWDDAQAYVKWLAKKSGQPYRLLTEAEWEYAARAVGTATPQPRYSFGNDADKLCDYANGADQSAKAKFAGWTVSDCRDGYVYTAPAGSFRPNAFGLYDMHGNVWGWVEDCYKNRYQGAPADGSAITSGDCSRRALRGGSWLNSPGLLRSAIRLRDTADHRYDFIGFRVGRTL